MIIRLDAVTKAFVGSFFEAKRLIKTQFVLYYSMELSGRSVR